MTKTEDFSAPITADEAVVATTAMATHSVIQFEAHLGH
jgi:hypothetical protein